MIKRTSHKGEGYREAETRIQKALEVNAKDLSLANLNLVELPGSIGELSQLEALALDHNDLASLPECLTKLTRLRRLDVSMNPLVKVPKSLTKLSSLQVLQISYAHLTTLAESIGELTNLQQLHLFNNELTTLPNEIGRLVQLQELNLERNQLTSLPESLGQLVHLQRLDLSNNRLTALPESIGGLGELRKLYVDRNRLGALPESLRDLPVLKALYLHGNDGLGLPEEILGPTWQDAEARNINPSTPATILGYYFRVRVGKHPLNEAKLILVGRGGVGKTSLVNRLLYDNFNPTESKTDGIHISEWNVRLHNMEEVRLNLWDFGGQEIMHATHQFFLTQRSLYLLVLEGRQGAEDTDAEYWLKLIESFGVEASGELSPVLIVLNKIKDNPFDLNRRALQQKYPFVRGFLATDCQDSTGIDDLRAGVMRETDQLKHLRDAFPASWFAIKNKLASMRKTLNRDYIAFEEYRQICSENGENDSLAQESLVSYLHSLGIALNYKDDPRLRDTHILNPQWVTAGIYTILNAPRLAERKGELRLSDVKQILDPKAYPRHMHRFLFDLMKKFELCFAFPDDDAHYLIPELLDKQETEETAQFDPAACLNFEYRYPVLPEGLLPRFIVRTHMLSTNLPRWRTGVILAFEGNRALVKADIQDKRVFICVAGSTPGRRRLLAVIRSDLERIHAHISKLKPEAFVPLPGHPGESVPYEDLLVMEREGEGKLKKVIKGRLVEFDVQDLLNGVDLEGTRRRATSADAENAIHLFYSYTHKDETLRDELETHLKILERRNLIAPWHDRRIVAGEEWKDEIDKNLECADIILLLVSADFVASNYCWDKEMTRALERHETGEASVVPVIVRDVNWSGAPFEKLQALPKDAKAITEWPSRDAAWRDVSQGIERLIRKILADRRGN